MKSKRKKWFFVLAGFLSLVTVALLSLALEKQPSEDTVAVVDGSVITQKDFDREMSRVRQQLLNMGKHLTNSQIPDIKKEVLENLVNRELLYKESQSKGIKVDEAKVNEQIITLKKQFPSEDQFKSALMNMNISEAGMKAQIRRMFSIQQFIDTYIAHKATVSDEEPKVFYESHPNLFKQPEQARASHILIKFEPQADKSKKAEARNKIEKIKLRIQKGEDFSALAKEFSQCPSSAKGGDLGYFSRGQMVKPFEEAAFTLMPGDMSDIVETRFGYHLIKAVDKKPESIIGFKDVKDKIQQYIRQQKVQKEVSVYVRKLKEKAKVERFLTKDS